MRDRSGLWWCRVLGARDRHACERARQDFVTIVPGVRLADGDLHDQARVGTPREVATAGADVLVIGRPVSAAADRSATARRIHDEVADALGEAPRFSARRRSLQTDAQLRRGTRSVC